MAQDNLEPLITQCPNCDTRFRVTEAQLQIAHGRVRCGACLGVFDGAEHLSLDGEDVEPGGETDVDALLEELDEIGDEANPVPKLGEGDLAPRDQSQMLGGDEAEGLPEELLALEAEFMDEMRHPEQNTRFVEANMQAGNEVAESAALASGPASVQPSTEDTAEVQVAAEEADHAEPAEDQIGETEVAEADVPEAEASESEDKKDVAWVEDLEVDDWGDLESPEEGATPGVEEQPAAPLQSDDETDDLEIELQALPGSEDLVSNAEAAVPSFIEKAASSAAGQSPGELYEIEDTHEEAPVVRRSWLIYLLLLLGLIALPAQVLWYQYDAWVKDPEYRPVYEWMCGLTGCELPPLKDISLITAKRSIIRAHPDRENARIVDVLMVNNAEFAQPFPLIELMATNMRGQLVAGRRFKPTEYLQGELANAEMFPPRTPVHVSLEIKDPGADALNFEVKFR